MKIKFPYILEFFVILLLIILLGSCPNPVDDSDILPAPENVVAFRDGDDIVIQWNGVAGAETYLVYRKDGQGSFLNILSGKIINTLFRDSKYPEDLTVQYAVQSRSSGGFYSSLSEPSNTLSDLIQRLSATAYERTDGISIEWAVHPEDPDNYKIYRYRAKNLPPEAVFSTTTNTYVDRESDEGGPEKDTPYFYKVTWEKLGVEYGTNVFHVFGIFGETTDYGEPNGEIQKARALGLNAPAVTAKLFSFYDGDDGVAADLDWYVYNGPPAYEIITTVAVPPDTPFAGQELRFYFYYDGTAYPETVLLPGDNIRTFSDFGGASGDIELYFRIYPVVDSTSIRNGTYSVSISDEF